MNSVLIGLLVAVGISIVPAWSTMTPQSIKVDGITFTIPKEVGHMEPGVDCADVKYQRHYCATLKPIGLDNDQWSIQFIRGVNYRAYEKEFLPNTRSQLTDFKDLLSGSGRVMDHYSATGVLMREDENGVFALWPRYMSVVAAKDIAPMIIDGKVRGYAFTPLVGSGDFPPMYQSRTVYLYDEVRDLIIIVTGMNIKATGSGVRMEDFPWRKTVEGTLDQKFYENNYELVKFIDQYIPMQPQDGTAEQVARELYMMPSKVQQTAATGVRMLAR